MKSKKILLFFIIIFATLFILSVRSEATLELNNLDFDAQINEDGSMNVTETWNIYISETNTLFKTFELDDSKYTQITDVQVKETTSGYNKKYRKITQEMYHVTENCYYGLINSRGMFEIAWGTGMENRTGTKTYEISYTVKDAIAKYTDCSELYWQFIGDDFEIDAKRITGKITLPNSAESKEDIRVWGHTKDLNGEIYAVDTNTIEFEINNYSSGNYVEVRTLFPNYIIETTGRQYNKNILDEAVEEETIWANEANARREIINKSIDGIIIAIGAVILFFIIKMLKNIVKLKNMEAKLKPETKLDYFRELPYEDATPAEALFVISSGENKAFSASFSAYILDLCLKKHISLEVIKEGIAIKSKAVKITINNNDTANLKEDEKLTLDFLKEVAGEKNELTTNDITKYLKKYTPKVEIMDIKLRDIIEDEEMKNGNYIKENDAKRNKFIGTFSMYVLFAVLCIIFMTVLYGIYIKLIPFSIVLVGILIINGILNGIMAYKTNLFTQKGVEEKEKWKAFKKYMEDFSLLNDKEIPALAVWEKYLVFATAFGISEKVLKQLKVKYPEITDMNSGIYTSYAYIHIMNSINIGNCINSSVYSAIGSSGSGLGGGFSGGGGGGRWPEAAAEDANHSPKYFTIKQKNVIIKNGKLNSRW